MGGRVSGKRTSRFALEGLWNKRVSANMNEITVETKAM
jgi:hypothetical protein